MSSETLTERGTNLVEQVTDRTRRTLQADTYKRAFVVKLKLLCNCIGCVYLLLYTFIRNES